jgi:hypothetical protein
MLPCVVFQIPKQNLKSSHLYILWCLLLLRYLEDCLFLPRIYCIPVPENTVGNVPKKTVQDFHIFTVFLIPFYINIFRNRLPVHILSSYRRWIRAGKDDRIETRLPPCPVVPTAKSPVY